jgi:hypothetical protein
MSAPVIRGLDPRIPILETQCLLPGIAGTGPAMTDYV